MSDLEIEATHLNQPAFAKSLLGWWDAGHSDLPWRQTKDPYAIWVAEVMLQQTQIATAVRYYDAWMSRFPSIATLARASIDEVLKVWQGLGYYSRARNLHAAAQVLVETYNGQLPADKEQLMKLPGIGRYTAGAIVSIAFGKAEPALDGNIIRVLSRITDLERDVTSTLTRNTLWQLAAALVPDARPGDYNEALMELGQKVCLSQAPQCASCPVANYCLARARGTQLERPVKPPRKRIPHYDVVAGVIWLSEPSDNGKFLITRRPLENMLGGLWEFPGGKVEDDENHCQALRREVAEELDIAVAVEEHLTSIRHAYTHFRITLHVYCARLVQGEPKHIGVADHAWVTLSELDRYAFAVTDLQIIETLRKALYRGA